MAKYSDVLDDPIIQALIRGEQPEPVNPLSVVRPGVDPRVHPPIPRIPETIDPVERLRLSRSLRTSTPTPTPTQQATGVRAATGLGDTTKMVYRGEGPRVDLTEQRDTIFSRYGGTERARAGLRTGIAAHVDRAPMDLGEIQGEGKPSKAAALGDWIRKNRGLLLGVAEAITYPGTKMHAVAQAGQKFVQGREMERRQRGEEPEIDLHPEMQEALANIETKRTMADSDAARVALGFESLGWDKQKFVAGMAYDLGVKQLQNRHEMSAGYVSLAGKAILQQLYQEGQYDQYGYYAGANRASPGLGYNMAVGERYLRGLPSDRSLMTPEQRKGALQAAEQLRGKAFKLFENEEGDVAYKGLEELRKENPFRATYAEDLLFMANELATAGGGMVVSVGEGGEIRHRAAPQGPAPGFTATMNREGTTVVRRQQVTPVGPGSERYTPVVNAFLDAAAAEGASADEVALNVSHMLERYMQSVGDTQPRAWKVGERTFSWNPAMGMMEVR